MGRRFLDDRLPRQVNQLVLRINLKPSHASAREGFLLLKKLENSKGVNLYALDFGTLKLPPIRGTKMKIRTVVISCALSLVASQAHAQTFQRTSDGRYVEYSHGDFLVRFDSQFGGAPTEWFYKGRPTSSPHPGEAVNLTFDTGQDGTQTSANGVDPNPVARWGFNDPSVYYLRETAPLSTGS